SQGKIVRCPFLSARSEPGHTGQSAGNIASRVFTPRRKVDDSGAGLTYEIGPGNEGCTAPIAGSLAPSLQRSSRLPGRFLGELANDPLAGVVHQVGAVHELAFGQVASD